MREYRGIDSLKAYEDELMQKQYLYFYKIINKIDNFKFSKENQDDIARYFIGLATAATIVFFSLLFSETINFLRAGLSLCAILITLYVPFWIRRI